MPQGSAGRASAALAARLPDRWFTAAIARTYPRSEPELARLADFCPAHGTALDIGAWYGPWSRALARRVDRVVAVEPNPAVASVLARTTPGNVRVVQAAIADHVGHARLHLSGGGSRSAGTASLRASAGGSTVEVATTTIDELAIDDVTIIKLDVEGGELDALHGARATLRRHRPVLLVELEYRHGPVDEVLDYLADFGYQGEVLVDNRWRPLADFDLATHQARLHPVIDTRGYLRRVLQGGPRYVNNVLFRSP
jgi:FkbM family methyltransferase